LVGSPFFNFNEDNGVQDEVVLEIKAKRRCSIDKTSFIDKLERVLSEGETVKKVTADIYDEDDNHRIINTEEFSKQITINVGKNEYGEIDSEDIFMKMRDLV
jgi:phosphatidate phosphatase PAH1